MRISSLQNQSTPADQDPDTKHWWKLTKHIFRYGHVNEGDHYNGAHTVNEGKYTFCDVRNSEY